MPKHSYVLFLIKSLSLPKNKLIYFLTEAFVTGVSTCLAGRWQGATAAVGSTFYSGGGNTSMTAYLLSPRLLLKGC